MRRARHAKAMPRHERPNPDTDPFRPPAIPTEVYCLQCGHEYESYLIQWHEHIDQNGEVQGYWCCPTPDCPGRGFGFDIFPTDPDYRGEDGEPMWSHEDDEFSEGDDEEGFADGSWSEEYDADAFLIKGEPFDLGLPPMPDDAPPPLEVDFGDEPEDRDPPSSRRRRFNDEDEDISF